MSDRPALLWYCQHSVGLGHLVRSYSLCAALAERFRVVLLCGGALPEAIRPPAGVQVLALPPLGVGEGGGFVSHDPRYSLEQAWGVRRERILAAYRAVRPSAVVVELFPFGRAKFARELVPLLEAARADGALTACSLRDILVSARANQQAPRRPRRCARRRPPRRRARPQRPGVRAARGDVRAAGAAARARPLHRLRRPRGQRGRFGAR